MTLPILATPLENFVSMLADDHTPGGPLRLLAADTARVGTPTPDAPVRVKVCRVGAFDPTTGAVSDETLAATFLLTGVSGQYFTAVLEDGSDQVFPVGSLAGVVFDARTVSDIHAWLVQHAADILALQQGGGSGSGSGSVTSVALALPAGFSVSGTPVTGNGTLAVTTALSGIVKGTGSGFANAVPDTDYPAVATVTTALGLKAPLASPPLSGVPTAPTATVGTNTTQVATTAFVLANAGGLVNGAFHVPVPGGDDAILVGSSNGHGLQITPGGIQQEVAVLGQVRADGGFTTSTSGPGTSMLPNWFGDANQIQGVALPGDGTNGSYVQIFCATAGTFNKTMMAELIPSGANAGVWFFGPLNLPIASVRNAANDAAAAALTPAVPVGGVYRNGSALMIRAS